MTFAHLGQTGFGPLIDGMVRLGSSTQDLLMLLGVLIVVRQNHYKRKALFAAIVILAWLLAAFLALVSIPIVWASKPMAMLIWSAQYPLLLLVQLAIIVVGFVGAAAARLDSRVVIAGSLLLMFLFGLGSGWELSGHSYGFIAVTGEALSMAVQSSLVLVIPSARLGAWAKPMSRVVASWIATIAMFSLAFYLRNPSQ